MFQKLEEAFENLENLHFILLLNPVTSVFVMAEAIPRFTKIDIQGMKDQRLSMNLNSEGLDSTGSETEKRLRLLEHFYPPSDEALSPAPVSRYTVDQVKSLLVEPLRSISIELGLPILDSETKAKLTKPILRDQLIGFIQSQGQNENPVTVDFDFSRKGAILKRIPQASRVQVCILLTTVISNLVANVNDTEVWKVFFCICQGNSGQPKSWGEKVKIFGKYNQEKSSSFWCWFPK